VRASSNALIAYVIQRNSVIGARISRSIVL
jgi:hypothetical protein